MNKIHYVKDVIFSGDNMLLNIDGKEYTFELRKYSKKLFEASPIQRENYIITSSGYGIHWPLIDEDLSIDGLLGKKHEVPVTKKVG